MASRVTVDDRAVKALLGRARKSLQDGLADELERIVVEEKAQIQARTASGFDADERTFKRYSPQYAAFRAKKSLQVAPPNLTRTGSMLRSISTKVQRLGRILEGRLFIRGADDAAKAVANEKLGRRFFAFSQKQQGRIRSRFAAFISKTLR